MHYTTNIFALLPSQLVIQPSTGVQVVYSVKIHTRKPTAQIAAFVCTKPMPFYSMCVAVTPIKTFQYVSNDVSLLLKCVGGCTYWNVVIWMYKQLFFTRSIHELHAPFQHFLQQRIHTLVFSSWVKKATTYHTHISLLPPIATFEKSRNKE